MSGGPRSHHQELRKLSNQCEGGKITERIHGARVTDISRGAAKQARSPRSGIVCSLPAQADPTCSLQLPILEREKVT